MTRSILTFACACWPFALSFSAEAQPLGFGDKEWRQELESDRPDFTEGTQTIQTGHVQIESGYTYSRDEADGAEAESHTLPELLLRLGLLDRLEGRIAWAGYEHDSVEAAGDRETTDGATDMGLGFKYAISPQSESFPALSLIGELGLPVGSTGISSEEVEPGAKLLWAYDLTDATAVAGNINATSVEGESERYTEMAASATVGTDLSERFGGYLEYFGFYPTESVPENTEHYFNGGITFSVTEDLQLDARVGMGLNDHADDFFTGVGAVWRR